MTYILLDASRIDPIYHLEFSLTSETNTKLPFNTYTSSEAYNLPDCSVVVTTPLLSTKKIIIEITELDSNNDEKNKKIIHLNRESVKWQSRFNYKIKNQLMNAMRSIELKTMTNQIRIIPTSCSTCGKDSETLLFKGTISSSTTNSNQVVRLIDDQGIPTEECDIYLGKQHNGTIMTFPCSDRDITIRLPNNGKTYCLIVEDDSGTRSGIICFDPSSVKVMQACNDPNFYKVSTPDNYIRLLEKQKYDLSFRACCLNDKYEHGIADVNKPFFSIVVPLYQTPPKFLEEMIGSVINQSFTSWELILINASPDNRDMSKVLKEYSGEQIRIIDLNDNKGISENTNVGINAARGKYVCFLDHDDMLDAFTLSEYYIAIENDPSVDVLYCDEDFLNESGKHVSPHFKSDFNIDLLRCHNYITHMLAVRTKLAKQLMLDSEYDGAQDYEFILRLSEETQNFYHIPYVLYHWRIHENSTAASADNKNYADEAGRKALQQHASRLNLNATAELTSSACFYNLKYTVEGEPLVSIVIPNKDNSLILENCINSIYSKSSYKNLEVIIVENNSTENDTFLMYEKLKTQFGVKVIDWIKEFNYSAINNYGIESSSGDYIVLLNNDTEVIASNWIELMLALCQRDDIGIVGAKLFYPDNTIQHAGIAFISSSTPGEFGGPVHIFNNLDRRSEGYMRRAALRQDLLAVTGACMMIKRSLYRHLNGLNEKYAVSFNDVDLCLRAIDAGYLVAIEPDATLYHYESVSRGSDTPNSPNYARFLSEQGILRKDWSTIFAKGDPYFGEHFIRLP